MDADGAPSHYIIPVKDHLNNVFPIWIGNNGTIKWPLNSPDLTPMDSFFWGFLKDIVNYNNNNSIQVIKDIIRLEINNVNVNSEAISVAIRNMRRRYQLCIDNNGGHIEYLNEYLYQPITEEGKMHFFNILDACKWDNLYDADISVEEKFQIFTETLQSALNAAFPLVKSKKFRNKKIRWFTDEFQLMRSMVCLLMKKKETVIELDIATHCRPLK